MVGPHMLCEALYVTERYKGLSNFATCIEIGVCNDMCRREKEMPTVFSNF